MPKIVSVFMLLSISLVVSCTTPPPQLRLDSVLRREDFSQPSAWQPYVSAEQGIDFQIEQGAYIARLSQAGIMWALDATVHEDVVIDVETTQISAYRDNAYGLMCRAAPTDNGNGYYFLISADGQFTIRRGAADQIDALIQWRSSNAIRQDQAINRIRVACIGERLMLFVNDVFVAETTDSRYKRGYTGLSAGVTEGGTIEVWFDDLTIWSAAIP
ncbi:MAG: hypothetical protein SGJ24_06420 [Chloroflexota bacterium]|nr:hypothetical protein [Chloroflexota bacterium]